MTTENVESMPVDAEIDASGLMCPIPVLRLKQALNTLQGGQCLRVITTDPGSQKDFANFAAQTGHRLLAQDACGGRFVFVFEKRPD